MDDPPVSLQAALDDHINEQVEQADDVASGERPARGALLDQQYELLECQLGACGMNTGNRSGVP
jgi:hypothetical protein